jgi:hypothetical protein
MFENLCLFLCIIVAQMFCVLACISPLLGHGHSSVSTQLLFLQLFVKKRNRLREIMIISGF